MKWLLKMKIKYCVSLLLVTGLLALCIMYFMLDKINEYSFKEKEENGSEIKDHVPDYILEEEQEVLPWSENFKELDDGLWHDFDVDRVRNSVVNSLQDAENENLPFIIWWTPFTGDENKIKRCWVGDCFFTQNRSFQSHLQTQAFLFYGTDFTDEDIPLPRKENHEWGLFHEESPKNNALFYHEDTLSLFNHTATFKQESSYPISTQYINSAEYLLKPVTYTVAEKDRMKTQEGLAPVLYVQSGCNPPSDRDAYVQELMKYVKIDASGKCLHNKDLPKKLQDPMTMFDKEYLKFIAKYKFIISFENARCNDYMTEKIFRTIHVGAVPIYMGASNLREWLPDGKSVLMVDDFESPKDLAERINFLDQNAAEYEKMLEYKTKEITNTKLNVTLVKRMWGVNTGLKISYVTGFECHVCDQIHRNRNLVAEGKPPVNHVASFNHYGCPKPIKFPYDNIPNTEDWVRDVWGHEYENAKNRAAKLHRKVLDSK